MSQDNIFREIDEELRSDRMRNLWRRFGPYVIGAAIAVVVVVAVNEGWAWWQGSNAARSSDQFYSALDLAEKGDLAGAQAALDQTIASGSGGYPTLARFKEAALLAKEGKATEAIAAYDALSTSQSNQRLRELALVFAAYLLVDNGDVNSVQARVGGIAVPGNPLRNAALEAIGLAQYKAGDLQGARTTFETITADPMVSQGVRGRVQIYLAQLVSEGAVPPEEPATTPDAATAPDAAAPEATPAPAAETAPVAPAGDAAIQPEVAPIAPDSMMAVPDQMMQMAAPPTAEPAVPAATPFTPDAAAPAETPIAPDSMMMMMAPQPGGQAPATPPATPAAPAQTGN